MEIDEQSDTTSESTQSVQISQESDANIIQVPEVSNQLQIKYPPACSTVSCAKRIRVRKNLADLRRIQLTKYDHRMPVLSCNEQAQSGVKTHVSRFYHRSSVFSKREITTIQEEVLKNQPFNMYDILNASKEDRVQLLQLRTQTRSLKGVKSKSKDYKEKVASLKLLIQKIRQTNLDTPFSLQSSIPDETIQLFEQIHI